MHSRPLTCLLKRKIFAESDVLAIRTNIEHKKTEGTAGVIFRNVFSKIALKAFLFLEQVEPLEFFCCCCCCYGNFTAGNIL